MDAAAADNDNDNDDDDDDDGLAWTLEKKLQSKSKPVEKSITSTQVEKFKIMSLFSNFASSISKWACALMYRIVCVTKRCGINQNFS